MNATDTFEEQKINSKRNTLQYKLNDINTALVNQDLFKYSLNSQQNVHLEDITDNQFVLLIFENIEIYLQENKTGFSDMMGYLNTKPNVNLFKHVPEHIKSYFVTNLWAHKDPHLFDSNNPDHTNKQNRMFQLEKEQQESRNFDILTDQDFKYGFIKQQNLIFDDHQLKQLIRRPDLMSRSLIDNIMGIHTPIIISDKMTSLSKILILMYFHNKQTLSDSVGSQLSHIHKNQLIFLKHLLYKKQTDEIFATMSNEEYHTAKIVQKNIRFMFVNYILTCNKQNAIMLKNFIFPNNPRLSIHKQISVISNSDSFIVNGDVSLIKDSHDHLVQNKQNLDDLQQITTLIQVSPQTIDIQTIFQQVVESQMQEYVSSLNQNVWIKNAK